MGVRRQSERVISQIVVSEKLGTPDTSTTTRLSVPVFETCRFDGYPRGAGNLKQPTNAHVTYSETARLWCARLADERPMLTCADRSSLTASRRDPSGHNRWMPVASPVSDNKTLQKTLQPRLGSLLAYHSNRIYSTDPVRAGPEDVFL
jgi:hypothetical protein